MRWWRRRAPQRKQHKQPEPSQRKESRPSLIVRSVDVDDMEHWCRESPKSDLNSGISAGGVSLDSAALPWHVGEHCMMCYLGADHECREPEYILSRQKVHPIRRKALFSVLNRRSGEHGAETGFGGVSISQYSAYITYMVRYDYGMCEGEAAGGMPHHTHEFGEEYLVLRGSFNDNRISAPAMTWVMYPPGSDHHAYPQNCDVMTWWGQMQPASFKAKPMPWWTSRMHDVLEPKHISISFSDPATDGRSAWVKAPYGHKLALFEGEAGEVTRAECWFPGATHAEPVPAFGAELYVVSGSVWDRGKERAAGWWMRHSVNGGRTVARTAGDDGCLLLCKSGHWKHIMDSDGVPRGGDAGSSASAARAPSSSSRRSRRDSSNAGGLLSLTPCLPGYVEQEQRGAGA